MILKPLLQKLVVCVNVRRCGLALAIGSLLFIAYLLTFSGVFKADDEKLWVDATHNLAIWGNLHFSQTSHLRGLAPIDVEPNQPLLSAPLYWLAYHTHWVGNVHTIFLFNPIITALTGILIFYYALDLGYRERTASFSALLFGLTTIAWPYAQTFFRESLAALMLIGAAFAWERWRRAFSSERNHHWKWLTVSILVTAFALLSKESVLLVLPALAAYAYPGWSVIKRRRRQVIRIGVGGLVLTVALILALFLLKKELGLFASRYRIAYWLNLLFSDTSRSWEGIAGFLISPGKGIWWYSPTLILALGAPFIVGRERWRESWLPLMLTLWFSISYAAFKGDVWSGGAGWGPRFMVPLTPFLTLAALPLLSQMIDSTQLWPRILLTLLFLWGLVIQIGGVYVNIYSYYAEIEAGTGQFVWLGPAIWSFRWSQAFGSLLFIPQAKTDLIWLTPAPDWLMIGLLIAGLVVVITLVLWLASRQTLSLHRERITVFLAPGLVVFLTLFALWRTYDDPRYQSNIPELSALRTYLDQNTQPGDTILLSTPTYLPYFLNYYKGNDIWYTLPTSPGERSSWEQQPLVVSDRVEDLIAPTSANMFRALRPGGSHYRNQPRFWLVVDSSPFHAWSTRPPEWYLAKYAYTVSVTEFSPTVRLVEYLSLHAPDSETIPAHRINAMYGDSIQLVGYDLATESTSRNPGAMWGVSLLWQAKANIAADYSIGVYILRPDGTLALQQDRQPVGGFTLTNQWKPGEKVRDNYGFIIPTTMPSGDYQLAVAVYDRSSLERLPVTSIDGTHLGDHMILGTIQVR